MSFETFMYVFFGVGLLLVVIAGILITQAIVTVTEYENQKRRR